MTDNNDVYLRTYSPVYPGSYVSKLPIKEVFQLLLTCEVSLDKIILYLDYAQKQLEKQKTSYLCHALRYYRHSTEYFNASNIAKERIRRNIQQIQWCISDAINPRRDPGESFWNFSLEDYFTKFHNLNVYSNLDYDQRIDLRLQWIGRIKDLIKLELEQRELRDLNSFQKLLKQTSRYLKKSLPKVITYKKNK